MSLQTKHIYEFGPFRLDEAEHLLLRDGEAVPLTPKAFDLLLALVERHGHLLEKEELLKKVWPLTFPSCARRWAMGRTGIDISRRRRSVAIALSPACEK
jgi:DNA-binding response OmpR family regulator